jgi:hypothetical protein
MPCPGPFWHSLSVTILPPIENTHGERARRQQLLYPNKRTKFKEGLPSQ